MNDNQPSTIKILWNDYVAFLAAIFCLMAPGLYIYDTYFANKPISNMLWITTAIFIVAFFFLIYRYFTILSLYNNGLEAKALITEIGFFRDRGIIKYNFQFNGQNHASHMRVMKNKKTTSYQVGMEIKVIVDRENPKRSLIKELFQQD
ncbi:MAG: hypothetical protein J0L96_21385 [Anaerolineae bacterium]|nr:hypothetical protein [Anaerolineae bacterium]